MYSDCSLLLTSLDHEPYQYFGFTLRVPEELLSKSLYIYLQAGKKPGTTQRWRNNLKQDPERGKKNLDVASAHQ